MRVDDYDSSFRTWQAVADLVHHIKPLLTLHLGAVAQAMDVPVREVGLAVARLRDDGFAFRRDDTLGLMDGLERIALAEDAGFDLAVVVLLADLLQSRVASPLLADIWPKAAVRLPQWPDSLRAAMAHGLTRARELGVIGIDPIAPALGVTRDAGPIAEHLLQIARSMRREELLAVAQADRGEAVERHHAALLACISQRDGIFQEDETWYPSEVVELVAHGPQHPGHAGCTAILLLNVLAHGDRMDWFGYRWQQQAAAYCALKPSQRDPILAALRYVYETDPEFLTLATVDFNPAGGITRTIPVVESL